MRILITGSRHHRDYGLVSEAIKEAISDCCLDECITVVEGSATGADRLARRYANSQGFHVETHEAQWSSLGKRAGVIRNQKMVDLGADICLAFPLDDSRGTIDCVRRARKAGIEVKVIQ